MVPLTMRTGRGAVTTRHSFVLMQSSLSTEVHLVCSVAVGSPESSSGTLVPQYRRCVLSQKVPL